MNAFLITLRELIEFSLIVLLLTGVYKDHKKTLISSAVLVFISGSLISLANYPLSGFLEKAYTGFMFYSFLMILFMSLVSRENVMYPVICTILAMLVPSAQLTSIIMDEASLKGGSVFVFALLGAVAGMLMFMIVLRIMSGFNLKRFFGMQGVMVFISAFCFLFGGLHEFSSASVVTSLQQGLNRFLTSFVINLKELLLVPQGHMITTALDGTLGFLASARFAMAVTALILFIPPVYVFIKLLFTPEPETEGIEINAERRKVVAVYLDDLIRKGTPLLFSLIVSIVMLHAANLAMNPKYDPEPIPVVADGDMITIGLTDKYGDVSDGRIRKYSFRHKGAAYRVIVMMRPDGEVVAALDACEICPPTGYVQRGEHIICKYCSTPIPVQSLGQSGGCNPIPVQYRIEGNNLTMIKDDIVRTHNKWVGKDAATGH